MSIFRLLTPITYWLLIVMWTFILAFLLRRLRSPKIESHLFATLIIILTIDAFRTLFESIYFGAWYTSLVGLLPMGVHDFLVRPANVFFPKFINVIVAALVIGILLYRWIPQEEQEREKHRNQITGLKRAKEKGNRAKEVAELANRAKSDFLSGMSHELRTPLNAIIGFSEVLRDKYFGDLNEKQMDYVNDILESGKHLLSLINDILDLSKVEAGKMKLELSRVKIKEMLENSLIMIKEKAMKHGISLDLSIPRELNDLEITADERKLKQIMFNLLSNAVKFTPDDGAITMEARKEEDELIISVSDTGIGIAPEDQEKIFEDFYQVQGGMMDKIPGTGLGLPLTKSLVEMHGGKIWVESEGLGKGSRFSFVLLMKPADLEIEPPEIRITRESTLLNHLNKTISLSKRHNRPFTFCRLYAGREHLEEKALDIKEALEKEKRENDFLEMDGDGYIYLILQETDRKRGKVVCDRFKKKLEIVLERQKVSCSMATFPEDGESLETLMEKVSSS